MKKVININFQGRVIPIEESAYDMLKQYVESLRRFFADEEGRDEIINDIEGRIAELFGESQSRVVLSCRPEDSPALQSLLIELGVAGMLVVIGQVGGASFSWSDDLNVSVKELARAWNTPF